MLPEVGLWNGLHERVRTAIGRLIDRGTVESEAGGLTTVLRVGTDDADELGTILGFVPPVGSEVLIIADTVIGIIDDGGSDLLVPARPVLLPSGSSPMETDFKSQSASDTASTTSTSTAVQALAFAVNLPDGEYTLRMLGSAILTHSGGATSAIFPEIDGAEGTGRPVSNTPISGGVRGFCDQERNGIIGGRSVTFKVKFRSSSSGTTAAKNPAIAVAWKRTG